MLRWAGASSKLWKPPVHTDRLGSVPRGGGNGQAGSGSQMWISRLLVPDAGNKVWATGTYGACLLLTFIFHLPGPRVGGSRARTLQAWVIFTSPSWPLHPCFPALNSHSLGDLSKILLMCVLAFWAHPFSRRCGRWAFKQ